MNRSSWMNNSWWRQEGDVVDEQSHVEAGGGRQWMNSSSWRLERCSRWWMNSSPWSSVLRCATHLPMNRTPVSTVALQHKFVSSVCGTPHPSRSTGPRFHRRRSVSSVLRYGSPLPMNRIPFRPWPVEHKDVSFILRYAKPRFHRLFHPSQLAPDEQHAFRCLPMNTTHSVASR